MRNLLLVFLLMSAATVHSQQKKPITHEEMWALKRVGTPQISPNGKLIIYSVTDAAYDEKDESTDLWIADADGVIPPRKLTATKTPEGAYTWSPDSKFIAFSARRENDEAAQIYLLNMAEGGEAQRLTNVSGGAASPKFSPDGKMLLFTSNVYPGCYTDSANKKMIEEKKKNKYTTRVYNSSPVRFWDQWYDEKQGHIFILNLSPGSTPKDIFAEAAMTRSEGFVLNETAWAPDSKTIVFSAGKERNTAGWQLQPPVHLYKISITGGDAQPLTADSSTHNTPYFSKKGTFLYCIERSKKSIFELASLIRYDWPSMQNRKQISASTDRNVNSFVEHGEIVYLSIEDKGRDRLYIAPPNGEPVEKYTIKTGCLNSLSVADNGTLVGSYESAAMPPEIVKLDTKTGGQSFITHYNDAKLAALDLPPAEEVWFTDSKGQRLRSLMIKPAGFDASKKYPLFVVIHGGPASSWKDNWSYRWNFHLLASPGYVLLCTDYTGSTGYGYSFTKGVLDDPMRRPGRETNEAAADAIARFPFIDGTRQFAGGGSYGGILSCWLEATTTHYKCLISHAGYINKFSQWGSSDIHLGIEQLAGGPIWNTKDVKADQNSILYANDFKTPMLVTTGELDYRVPFNNSIETFQVLQRVKIPSRLIVFPNENHWILKGENSRFWYKEVFAWIKQYVQ